MIALSRFIALVWWLLAPRRFRAAKDQRQTVLVLHQMLLGDGILLMPIFQSVPASSIITVACPISLIGLYKAFYPNYRYIGFSERRPLSVISMLLWGPYREVICPFERRMLRYARSCRPELIRTYVKPEGRIGVRVIQGKPPIRPATVSDIVLGLFPRNMETTFQPLPQLVEPLAQRICLLHVDAKNPNRRWTPDHWLGLAHLLRQNNFSIVWCLGPDPSSHSIPIDLNLDALFTPNDLVEYLGRIRRSALVICPDTGIAHLAKLSMTPTVVIYGQGNPALHGNGHYWSRARTMNLYIDDIECRDKDTAMGMKLDWLRRCDRSPLECSNPFCQNNIQPENVIKAIQSNFPELFS